MGGLEEAYREFWARAFEVLLSHRRMHAPVTLTLAALLAGASIALGSRSLLAASAISAMGIALEAALSREAAKREARRLSLLASECLDVEPGMVTIHAPLGLLVARLRRGVDLHLRVRGPIAEAALVEAPMYIHWDWRRPRIHRGPPGPCRALRREWSGWLHSLPPGGFWKARVVGRITSASTICPGGRGVEVVLRSLLCPSGRVGGRGL